MTRSDPQQVRSVNPELAAQIKRLRPEQLLALLKFLPQDNVTAALLRVVAELPAEQQQALASRLQGKSVEPAAPQETEISLRGYPRKSCMLKVHYSVAGRDFDSFMLDISPAGAFIETDEAVEQGQPIHLEFSLPPSPEPIALKGVILWKGMLGMGVKFTDPSPEQTNRITAFMEAEESL